MISVECDGVPHKGDTFYISELQRAFLAKRIKETGGYGDDWMYGINRDKFSIDDAIYVADISWQRDAEGIFRCHIELGDPWHVEEK